MSGNSDVELVLSLQVAEANKKMDLLAGKFDAFGNRAAKSTAKAQSGLDKIGRKAGAAAIAFLTLSTAVGAYNLAATSARAQDTIKIYEATGASIAELREQTKGLIDDATLAKNANLARPMGISSEEFAELANIANAASKATGESAEFMLESIVKGTARGSKLLLDNLGILVSTGKANKAYALANKKTVKTLTDWDKKQAFIHATLKAGVPIIEAAAKAGADAGEDFDRAKASVSNLATAIGNNLIPMMSSLARYTAMAADAYTWLIDGQEKLAASEAKTNQIAASAATAGKKIDSRFASIRRKHNIPTASRGEIEELAKVGDFTPMGFTDRFNLSAEDLKALRSSLKRIEELKLELSDASRKISGRKSRAQEAIEAKQKKEREKAAWKLGAKDREKDRQKEAQAVVDDFNSYIEILDKEDERHAVNAEAARARKEEADDQDLADLNAALAYEDELEAALDEGKQERQQNLYASKLSFLEASAIAEETLSERVGDKRKAINAEIHAQTMAATSTGIGIATDLAQTAIEMQMNGEKHAMETLIAMGLARVGSEFVSTGSLFAVKGIGMAIENPLDPRGYALSALGAGMIGTGLGMGAGSIAINQSIGGGGAGGGDSVGSRAVQNRGNGTQNIGSASVVRVTVNYGVMGPDPDSVAKGVSQAMTLARKRGMA